MAQSFEQTVAPALESWLAERVPGFAGPLEISKFAGGQSNPTYLLTTPTRKYVMRAKPGPAARLLPSAHAIDREYRVITAVGRTDVPVPRTYGLCEDESVIGRAFFVMEHVDGRILWQQSLPDMAPAERGAIYEEMNRVIAALHALDYSAIGLADYGKPSNYLVRQVGRWTRQYQAAATTSIAEMDRLIEWLPAHIPSTDETVIVHGDFRIDNMIFARDATRVVAVLDWELSTLGDPLADFAYHCLAWHLPPGQSRGLDGLDLAPLGIPAERDHLARYCERTGRAIDAVLPHWDFYIAFNLFRLASIAQGIVKRVIDGTASNKEATADNSRVAMMASKAWNIARRHA